jgi:hypothetical protein
MSREVKRVPLDFCYPLHVIWAGYCNPFYWTHDGKISDDVIDKYGDLFKEFEPPLGDGYQLWETVSEGSPISPVFQTLELLCDWLGSHPMKNDVFSHFTKADWIKALESRCPMMDIHTKELIA